MLWFSIFVSFYIHVFRYLCHSTFMKFYILFFAIFVNVRYFGNFAILPHSLFCAHSLLCRSMFSPDTDIKSNRRYQFWIQHFPELSWILRGCWVGNIELVSQLWPSWDLRIWKKQWIVLCLVVLSKRHLAVQIWSKRKLIKNGSKLP